MATKSKYDQSQTKCTGEAKLNGKKHLITSVVLKWFPYILRFDSPFVHKPQTQSDE